MLKYLFTKCTAREKAAQLVDEAIDRALCDLDDLAGGQMDAYGNTMTDRERIEVERHLRTFQRAIEKKIIGAPLKRARAREREQKGSTT